jgi:hypothetical protein
MFVDSASVGSPGLAPVWTLAVTDSGRSVEVTSNRSASALRFPLDSAEAKLV